MILYYRGEEAPKFVEPLKDTELIEGSTAEIAVTVTGTRHIHVTWFRENVQIVTDKRHTFSMDGDTHIMRISPVTFEDESMYYKVLAENAYGEDFCEAEIIVEGTDLLRCVCVICISGISC